MTYALAASTKRRDAIVRSALAAAALAASRALPAATTATRATMHRVGVLCDIDPSIDLLWQQLRALGYEEHRNLKLVFKDLDASSDVDGVAAKLAAANVDVIVACANVHAKAAMRATSRIPIVLLFGAVPVETGLVAALSRPGGNVTGTEAISTEMARKSVELLKSAVPTMRRVAEIVDLEDPVGAVLHRECERAASALGLVLTAVPVGSDEASLARAFAALARDRPDGLLVSLSALAWSPQIIAFAARARLPAIYPTAPDVTQGGLLAYAPKWEPQARRNAEIVDRILHGARPADIPVEQPVRYALGVNLRTARALGLTLPTSLLLRATFVVR